MKPGVYFHPESLDIVIVGYQTVFLVEITYLAFYGERKELVIKTWLNQFNLQYLGPSM
jgi:hypothetical protein